MPTCRKASFLACARIAQRPDDGCPRVSVLDDLDDWLRERFFRHEGNADVIRQELESEHGIVISLRSVERRVRVWRRELTAQKRATVRYETAPGHQMQIDFGDTRVWIGGERVRTHVFVATLGYSRRLHIRASQRQTGWFEGMEGAFLRFGGVPAEVLIDNAKALVEHHDAVTREVRFNTRLHAFARYWGFRPRACAPYRARTKDKDEHGVGYVKKHAIAGRRFESWAAFETHLDRWTREVTDQREHGTTGVAPAERFAAEAGALRPLSGRGESVQVVVLAGRVIVRHAGQVVADHALCRGRRQRIVDRSHCVGIAGIEGPVRLAPIEIASAALLRPLAEYEAVVGGGW